MVSELLSDPRTGFAVASAVLAAPFFVGVLAWVLSLPWLQRFGLGVALGIVLIAVFHLIQLHRSRDRRSKTWHMAQLCQLNEVGLRRLLPGRGFPSWIGQTPDFHKVSWLNKQLEEIWPSLNEATSGLLKETLQSVLDSYKFSVIQTITVKSITLGTICPLLGGIKLSGGTEECILEVEFDWRHGQDSKIVIQLQTAGPLLTAQVKNLSAFGVLKLVFKPLKDEFPGFGAVTISLQEPPVVDFQTQFLGGDMLMIPGVDNAVDNIIWTALTDTLVWPNRIVIPILDGDYSYLQLKPVGQLEVELLEAKELSKQDIFGESDPFILIYIRCKQGCIKTSSIKSNTHSPVWNEKFTFDVEDLETQKITLKVLDDDQFKPADLIGIAELPLNQFKPNQQHDLWVDLVADPKKPAQQSRGKVHLCFFYKPFNSDEVVRRQAEKHIQEDGSMPQVVEADEGRAFPSNQEKSKDSGVL
eukprot:c18796_g1_i1 orf=488-1900(+)